MLTAMPLGFLGDFLAGKEGIPESFLPNHMIVLTQSTQ
jgi:hypothetical protein